MPLVSFLDCLPASVWKGWLPGILIPMHRENCWGRPRRSRPTPIESGRLKEHWDQEYQDWRQRYRRTNRYAYIWAEFDREDPVNQDRHHPYLRLATDGVTSNPFSARTGLAFRVVACTRRRYVMASSDE